MDPLVSVRRLPLGLFPVQPTLRLSDCMVEAMRSRHYGREWGCPRLFPSYISIRGL